MARRNRAYAVAGKSGRSRVTTGRYILPNLVDARSQEARRYRDIAAAVIQDSGGLDRVAEARLQLIRRFAGIAVLAEKAESKLVNGEEINITDLSLLCSTLVRIATRIGIGRRSRAIVPHLSDYIDIQTKEQQEAEAKEEVLPPEEDVPDNESDDDENDNDPASA
jgi:hypothetical protein